MKGMKTYPSFQYVQKHQFWLILHSNFYQSCSYSFRIQYSSFKQISRSYGVILRNPLLVSIYTSPLTNTIGKLISLPPLSTNRVPVHQCLEIPLAQIARASCRD